MKKLCTLLKLCERWLWEKKIKPNENSCITVIKLWLIFCSSFYKICNQLFSQLKTIVLRRECQRKKSGSFTIDQIMFCFVFFFLALLEACESSRARDQTHITEWQCQILNHLHHKGSLQTTFWKERHY